MEDVLFLDIFVKRLDISLDLMRSHFKERTNCFKLRTRQFHGTITESRGVALRPPHSDGFPEM